MTNTKPTKYTSKNWEKHSLVNYHAERIERIRTRCEKHAKSKVEFIEHEWTIMKGSKWYVYEFTDEKGNYHLYKENAYDRRHFILI